MNKEQQIAELERKIEAKQNEWASTDAIQYALKIMMNSFYGCYSNEYFRWFDLRLAAAVTSLGQISILGPMKLLEETWPILPVEYADTDSLFISLKKVIDKRFPDGTDQDAKRKFAKIVCADMIMPVIESYFERMSDGLNAYKNTYEMDFETIADKSIFVGKKRYVMNKVYDDGFECDFPIVKPDLKVKGIEVVRTSTPLFIRDSLKVLLETALLTGSNDECLKNIEKMRVEFKESPFEKVAFPRTANNLNEFTLESKSLPIGVRAALVYNKAILDHGLNVEKISSGNKIRFSYIKEPNVFGGNVIGCPDKMPKQLSELFDIDYELQFEKAAMAPIALIFKALKWNTEKVASLDSFFD